MRLLVMLALSCAMAGVAAAADMLRTADCPGGQCPATLVPSDVHVDARPIARIVNVQGSARTMGTGTLVDVGDRRGLVLTCAHLFRDGVGSIRVTFPDGESFAGALLKIDAGADLAALAIGVPAIRPVELAGNFPQRGDPLVSCGYGGDGRLWCNRGRALGYVTTLGSHGRETLELSGAARMGDSGGPVLDGSGHLVAVLFGTDGRVVDGTFCGRIRRFLQGLSPRFRRGQPRTPPSPVEAGEPLVEVAPPPVMPQRPPQESHPQPPNVELPPGLEGIGAAPSPIDQIAQPWLAARLTALLVSFGVPGGIAGVAGGAIVWLVMRRGKKKLQDQLDRLKSRLGELPGAVASAAEASVVERHHNQYVPYEASLLDKAWAAAHARVGERYPGAVPYLKIVEGVKDQLLSGNEEPLVS